MGSKTYHTKDAVNRNRLFSFLEVLQFGDLGKIKSLLSPNCTLTVGFNFEIYERDEILKYITEAFAQAPLVDFRYNIRQVILANSSAAVEWGSANEGRASSVDHNTTALFVFFNAQIQRLAFYKNT